jgi:outer membrane autotransporter protein
MANQVRCSLARGRARRLANLLTGTAACSLVMVGLLAATPPALADGGAGGGNSSGGGGGAGGTGFTGNAGGSVGGGNGGGGGGAGGGNGGNSGVIGGGAGGTAGSPDGGNGVAFGIGSSGGGGGFNGNGAAADPTVLPAAPFALVGGNGGTGANFAGNGNGGGGGGAGGYGAVLTGTGLYVVGNTSSITGGNGGAGGNGDNVVLPARGGGGGDGGVGLQFTQSGVSLTNAGTITGGNGGARGIGGLSNGNFGAGGAGVVGAGLTIINNGTITGGLSGDGVTRTDAIIFTGGTNFLSGTGTVGSFTMTSGGTFAPGSGVAGTVMTVSGNLAFQAGAFYLVQVAGTASRANVSGTATLAGTVQFVASGIGNFNILHANGGLIGTFGGVAGNSNFFGSLSYGATDVFLNVTAATLGAGTSLNQNQQSIANTINGFVNGGGVLPPGFGTVFGLTGNALSNALTQLSGEVATGIQPASNLSTGMFLNAMIDPFVVGRTGGFGQAMGYSPEQPSRVEVAAREAFAADMPVKARPPIATFEQRWSVWGAAYGGRNRTDGDLAVGSNDLRATAVGFAAGADYRVSPDSVIGAAVAIGENRWNVSALGKGNADVAQVGGYASSRWGALYVSGAVSLGWHRASTDRTVTIAGTDRLEADFNATSFGGRLEGGYRYGGFAFGVTPYAAVQVVGIHTPAYTEVATQGQNQFALSYRAQSVNDIRTELGFWADTRHAMGNGTQLVLRGRAAWVHDYNPGSRVQAAFFTLPGTGFVVDGAAAPRDAALTSAVAEVRFANGVSMIGKFDGEFSGRSHTLAGTGTLRYAW